MIAFLDPLWLATNAAPPLWWWGRPCPVVPVLLGFAEKGPLRIRRCANHARHVLPRLSNRLLKRQARAGAVLDLIGCTEALAEEVPEAPAVPAS
jgi:hypothetical protein